MQHPEEGIIHAWLDGALPPSEAAALESHVASCAECEARVAEARGLIAASSRIVGHLDAVPAKALPATQPKRRIISWRNPWLEGAVAAALVLGIGLYTGFIPEFGGVREQLTVDATPKATRPPIPESLPVAAAPRNAEPPTQQIADQRSQRRPAAEASTPTLPPANAARQGVSQPLPEPAPQKLAASPTAPVRIDNQAAESRAKTADIGRVARSMAAGGVAGGAAAAAAPPSAMMAPRSEDAAVSARTLAGCYEMNASTEVLPARFALDADSSAISGLMSIRYVDADGRPTSLIADLGWTFDLTRVIVKTQSGDTLLTLRKTGSAVAGTGRSGSRTGRVVSCTR